MYETSERFWEIFFEVYQNIPRQGPGNRSSAERALGLCTELPREPLVLDLGCGSGRQTFYLAELTSGFILAVDNHAPFISLLDKMIAEQGLSKRIRTMIADMAHPERMEGDYDLIWSEGALYNIGIENALRICFGLLRPGGYLVFTDAVWRTDNPLPEVKAGFDLDYPGMGRVEDVLAMINSSGFEINGHFTLPDEAWWGDFYTPMQSRIDQLRDKYEGDAEAEGILSQLAQESEMHRLHSDCYAYEFFIVRKP